MGKEKEYRAALKKLIKTYLEFDQKYKDQHAVDTITIPGIPIEDEFLSWINQNKTILNMFKLNFKWGHMITKLMESTIAEPWLEFRRGDGKWVIYK